MKIITPADRTTAQGSQDWFTGTVWLEPLVAPAGASQLSSAQVSFMPGARTHWHTHPAGQTLFVVSGLGWVQLAGEPAQAIRAGDIVSIAEGENHWHGAQATHAMVHIAMQESVNGTPVTWGRPVTDEEYAG